MSETYVTIRVYFADEVAAKKTQRYLAADSRPDFEEEVAEEEYALFNAVEMLEYPSEVERLSSEHVVDIHYNNVWEDEVLEVCSVLRLFAPKATYVFMMDDEDYKGYQCFNSDSDELDEVYVVGEDDDFDETLYTDDFGRRSFDAVLKRLNFLTPLLD